MVLATNGAETYALFNYMKVEWTSSIGNSAVVSNHINIIKRYYMHNYGILVWVRYGFISAKVSPILAEPLAVFRRGQDATRVLISAHIARKAIPYMHFLARMNMNLLFLSRNNTSTLTLVMRWADLRWVDLSTVLIMGRWRHCARIYIQYLYSVIYMVKNA